MQDNAHTIRFAAKHKLSAFVIVSLVLFAVFAALDLKSAQTLTIGLRDSVTRTFDWLFVYGVSAVLVLAIGLAFHPRANARIGRPSERPEFSRWSWFAMLFSAGLASGLVYWGAAEPITHFAGNPFADSGANPRAAATTAVTVTIFHWGLHGWGLYAIGGLAIGLSAYRRGAPLTFSAALTPVFGDKSMHGLPGRMVDLLALYGTVFGVATSIGLAVGSMNASLAPLTGLPFDLYTQLGIVLAVSTLGVLSVLSGVANGIRRLSEANVWLSLALLLAVIAAGPSLWLLHAIPANAVDYFTHVLPMGMWLADSAKGHAWQSAWTVFYWGWWLAWTPFVALFIARISKGRTIREFIIGVLAVPSIVVIAWMSVFGGTALHQEIQSAGAVSAAVNADYSLGLVAAIENLSASSLHVPLLIVVAVLLFTWMITSIDSATLVICHILHVDHLGSMKVLWGFVLGGITCTLMLIGGIEALQAASIIIGLPMALLMLCMAAAAFKLVTEPQPADDPAADASAKQASTKDSPAHDSNNAE